MERMGSATLTQRERKSPASDAMVLAAMALIAAASGAGAYFEMGMAGWLAAALSLAIFAVLAGIHLAVRRSAPVSASRTDIAQLEAEIAKLNAVARGARQHVRGTPPGPAGQEATVAGRANPGAHREPQRSPALTLPQSRPAHDGRRRDGKSAPDGQERPGGATHDFWPHAPAAPAPTAGSAPPAASAAGPESIGRAVQTPKEADVELVQGMVKKLADQVTAAEADAAREPSREPQMDGAIEASLEALRATADTMRTASGLPPATPADQSPNPGSRAVALPVLPPPAAAGLGEERLAVLAEALSAGRADVLLEPILNLEDRRVRHYGVSLRLRTANGDSIDGRPGRDPGETAFGPAMDGLRLARTALLARRLAERGKMGFIFFDVGAPALGSDRFLAEFAALCQEPTAWVRQLVPVFSQADVATFTNREWDALRDIGKAGLCFSLDALESLDMNFAVIKTWGFAFAQIDAGRYLDGLSAAGKSVPPAEATRRLVGTGLTPIVSGIDEDMKLAPIMAAGAVLGRGPLFGAPRPVKAEALESASQQAA